MKTHLVFKEFLLCLSFKFKFFHFQVMLQFQNFLFFFLQFCSFQKLSTPFSFSILIMSQQELKGDKMPKAKYPLLLTSVRYSGMDNSGALTGYTFWVTIFGFNDSATISLYSFPSLFLLVIVINSTSFPTKTLSISIFIPAW